MKRSIPVTPFTGRIRLVTGIFICLFALLIVRLSVLQIGSAAYYKSQAADQHAFFDRLAPSRGEIKVADKTSAENLPVATNIHVPLVYVIPKSVSDPLRVAQGLSSVLGIAETDILAKLQSKDKVYVPIKRRLTQDEVETIKALHLPGVAFDDELVRYYPERTFLSHVVGFLGYKENSGSERVGLYGIEKSFDQALSGQAGSLDPTRYGAGSWLFGVKQAFQAATNGSQLLLTIDRSIQLTAEQVLASTVEAHQADGGCVVVMDPKTGSLLAMASNPSYDPNEYNKVTNQAVFSNLCTTGSYEPGSVFKAVTMAAALDRGAITPDTTYVDPGQVVVDGYTIKNSDGKAHGLQTMTQVLEESLNTGVIFAKNKVGNKTFLDYVQRFGFGKLTGLDIPESGGSLKNLNGNVEVNYDTASFGQGILVTPIQMVKAYAAIANNGRMPAPHVVAAQITPDGKTLETAVHLGEQIISQKTADNLSAMLVSVVEYGHGKRARVPGYYIAGKTGTAQVAKKDGPGYDPTNNIGTFVGYGPVEDPRFVMLVRINHPRTVQYAESTAGPAWGQIAKFILSYYNVPPNRPVK